MNSLKKKAFNFSDTGIRIFSMMPIVAVFFIFVFFPLAQARKSDLDYSCGFCFVFTRREVVITNHLPYTIELQCHTTDHSLKPQILHPSNQYSFIFRINVFWYTRYNCSFSARGKRVRKFEAFYSMYDCNNEKADFLCKWEIGEWDAKRYSWEKKSWLPYQYQ